MMISFPKTKLILLVLVLVLIQTLYAEEFDKSLARITDFYHGDTTRRDIANNVVFIKVKKALKSIPVLGGICSSIMDFMFPGPPDATRQQVLSSISSKIDESTKQLLGQMKYQFGITLKYIETIAPTIQKDIYSTNELAAARAIGNSITILINLNRRLELLGDSATLSDFEEAPCGYGMVLCNNAFSKIAYSLDDILTSATLGVNIQNGDYLVKVKSTGQNILDILYTSIPALSRVNSMYAYSKNLQGSMSTIEYLAESSNSRFFYQNFNYAIDSYLKYLIPGEDIPYESTQPYLYGYLQLAYYPEDNLIKGFNPALNGKINTSKAQWGTLSNTLYYSYIQTPSQLEGNCNEGQFLVEINQIYVVFKCSNLDTADFSRYADSYFENNNSPDKLIKCNRLGYYATGFKIKLPDNTINNYNNYYTQLRCSLPMYIPEFKQCDIIKNVNDGLNYIVLNGELKLLNTFHFTNLIKPNPQIIQTNTLLITPDPIALENMRVKTSGKKYFLSSTTSKQFIYQYSTIVKCQFDVEKILFNDASLTSITSYGVDIEDKENIISNNARGNKLPGDTIGAYEIIETRLFGLLGSTAVSDISQFQYSPTMGSYLNSIYFYYDGFIQLLTLTYGSNQISRGKAITTAGLKGTFGFSYLECFNEYSLTEVTTGTITGVTYIQLKSTSGKKVDIGLPQTTTTTGINAGAGYCLRSIKTSTQTSGVNSGALSGIAFIFAKL